jgi:nucleotide-binding universal stress UspA family protein
MKPLVIRRILVATDLTEGTFPAIRTARRLSELTDAELHVVHANEDVTAPSGLDERIAQWIAGAGGRLDVRLLAGPGGSAITQEAARTRADVIILGQHRNRAGTPNGTADRVVRTARVSCLILPTELALPLASVLVPVDVTDAARGELEVALSWASALRRRTAGRKEASSHIRALHVRSDAGDGQDEHLRSRLHAEVTTVRQQFAGIAGVSIDEDIAFGDVPTAITAAAQESGADLIVIGTRGKRIAEDPLGSVSSAVVKRAPGPILLVPPEVWRQNEEPLSRM